MVYLVKTKLQFYKPNRVYIYNLQLFEASKAIYNLQLFDLFGLQSTCDILAKSTIYKITNPPLLVLEQVLALPWWWLSSEVVTLPSYLRWNKCWLYPGCGIAQKGSQYLPTCTGTSAECTLVVTELRSGPCTFLLALEQVLTLPRWWQSSEVVPLPSYWLTHWLTDSLTDWLNNWLTHSVTQWLNHWLTASLTHSLTHSLTNWLTHWLTHSLTHSFTK